jgi:hypothetical protein
MRKSVLSGWFLLIGITAIGCGDGGPQGKIDPSLPVASVKIAGMT